MKTIKPEKSKEELSEICIEIVNLVQSKGVNPVDFYMLLEALKLTIEDVIKENGGSIVAIEIDPSFKPDKDDL